MSRPSLNASKNDFQHVVQRVIAQNENLAHLRPVIEKELLHYDILYALDAEGLLGDLTFRGGAALRLCRRSPRYSEDLEFAGGPGFNAAQLATMKACLIDRIGRRYSMDVRVKAPSGPRQANDSPLRRARMNVDIGQISVETAPQRKDIPRQRIKIEVLNVPAYTRETVAIHLNYDVLPQSYRSLLIVTESLNEIMADKLVAFPAAQQSVRYRDLWDLVWLKQHGATPSMAMIEKKIADYGIADYERLLDQKIAMLNDILVGPVFHREMRRFLPQHVQQRTLDNRTFMDYLRSENLALFAKVRDHRDPFRTIDATRNASGT